MLDLRRPQPSADLRGLSLPQPEAAEVAGGAPGRPIRCRACGAVVTVGEQKIAVAGTHVHRRENPAGVEFEFGCFAAAPGAAVVGTPTAEHSWFTGYAWSFALCRRCSRHLGWFYRGAEAAFFGLILAALREGAEPPAAGSR